MTGSHDMLEVLAHIP